MNEIIRKAEKDIYDKYGVRVKLLPNYNTNLHDLAIKACKIYSTSLAQLRGNTRKRRVADARKVFSFAANKHGYNHESIAYVINRERSTVSTAVKRTKDLIETDAELKEAINKLCKL